LRVRALILAAALSPAAFAQDLAPAPRGEIGLRYWLSTGETKHSHNAQGIAPTLGNPTSVLLYENLDAHVLELFGRANFADNWFLKGNLGLGSVTTGSFRDEDFNAGQVKFSDTTSSVPSGWIGYGTIDIGRNEWTLRQGRTTLGAFVGYSQWTESVDAYGATDHLGFIGGNIDRSVKVITNKVTWRSLRVGLAANLGLGERTQLSADFAFIPYAKARNEDSHHLRTNPSSIFFLGPVPNIIIEGEGRGAQLDAELRHEIAPRTELGIGVRYWYIKATKGTRTVPAFPGAETPIVELYSLRTGVTASLSHTW
jgi:hypothetical protein